MAVEHTSGHWQRWLQQHRLQLMAFVVWGGILLLIRQYLQSHDITFEELATRFQSVLHDNWYGSLLFVVIYLVRPLVLFPSFILTLLAGNVFGLSSGFVVALLGGIVSALPAYAMGRWFATDPPSNGNDTTILQRFADLLRRHPFQAILLMRLLYLPYDPVNFLAGYLNIPFSTYVLATALGNMPTTLAYISLGASFQGNLVTGQISVNPSMVALSVALFIANLGTSWFYNKRHKTSGESHSMGDSND